MSARARLLIVKTSSLGDVVHALPAVSDIVGARPDCLIDWVCEDAFADIPALHPGVNRVIPCAIRRWRRSWWASGTREEIARFKSTLREASYDCVLDLQGLVKSAWIARQARGAHHGYDWTSAREPLASLAYRIRHAVAWNQHAIERNRQLAAAALGYRIDHPLRYGAVAEGGKALDGPSAVALHATSRTDKLWPETSWRELATQVTQRGLRVIFPWGTEGERERSVRLAAGIDGAVVPDRMSPRQLASLFAAARIVIGVDTGLVHLAAAVGAPTLALFGATHPALTGVTGERAPALNLGGVGVVVTTQQVFDTAMAMLGDDVPALSASSAAR